MICDRLQLGLADEAFLAGLIHDIGIMVEMQANRHDLVSVFEEMLFDDDDAPTTDLREIESRILGADHQAFGAGLCETWKFPQSFAYVTGHHHDPTEVPPANRTLTSIVYIADRLSGQLGLGFRGDLINLDIAQEALDDLSLPTETLEQIKMKLPQAFEEIEAMFS